MIPKRKKEVDITYNKQEKKKKKETNPSYPQPESNHKIMSNGHFLVVNRI